LSVIRALIVEPDGLLRAQLKRALAGLAYVDADAAAPTARAHLLSRSYDWLITNIRLDAYNGLHLAYLAAAGGRPRHILVYGDLPDLPLAREAQQLGAFFECRDGIALALGSYLQSTLPVRDRRDPSHRDRRTLFRGGRRCSDFSGVMN
jgi:hypothetical protein